MTSEIEEEYYNVCTEEIVNPCKKPYYESLLMTPSARICHGI